MGRLAPEPLADLTPMPGFVIVEWQPFNQPDRDKYAKAGIEVAGDPEYEGIPKEGYIVAGHAKTGVDQEVGIGNYVYFTDSKGFRFDGRRLLKVKADDVIGVRHD